MLQPIWKSYAVLTPVPILNPKQCDELIKIGQTEPKIKAMIEGGFKKGDQTNNKIRKSQISWIPFAKVNDTYKHIDGIMKRVNINSFDFDNMQMEEEAQYTEYEKDGFYNWHIDIAKDMRPMPPVRKISMSILLNDPKEFEGGELELFNEQLSLTESTTHLIKLQRGQALFFASFFLHRVRAITKGNRKALVMWFGGTPFK